MVVLLSFVAFCLLYGIGGVIGIELLCSVSMIIGLTWWLIYYYKQQELLDEIKNLKKEIKKLEEKKL